jgi:hypothetical protein
MRSVDPAGPCSLSETLTAWVVAICVSVRAV